MTTRDHKHDSAGDLLQRIERAWADAPPPPSLKAVLRKHEWTDPELVCMALAADARERAQRDLEISAEIWLNDLGEAGRTPSVRLEAFVLEARQRRARGSADPLGEVRSRYGLLPAEASLLELLLRHDADPDPLGPGLKLGHYRLERELGRGSFGRVWMAHDEETDRYVALKLYRSKDAPEEASLEKVLAEARAASRIDNPHVVKIHRAGYFDQQRLVYMDCQLVGDPLEGDQRRIEPGRSFRDHALDDDGRPRLGFREVARILRDIARGVAAAHARGVIHRDIKPQNILVKPRSGEALLADFGLAVSGLKIRDSADPSRMQTLRIGLHEVLGTPAYLSPESAAGEPADSRSDVYGLGATLAYGLTGQHPHESSLASTASTADLVARIKDSDLPPLRTLRPEIPRALAAIADRALAKDPNERYQSAKEFADDLAAWIDHRPVQALKPGALERLRLWVRRNRLITATGAAVVGLAIAILVLGLRHLQELEAAERRNRQLTSYASLSATLHGLGQPGRLAMESFDWIDRVRREADRNKVEVLFINQSDQPITVWRNKAEERYYIEAGKREIFRPSLASAPLFAVYTEPDRRLKKFPAAQRRFFMLKPMTLTWNGQEMVMSQ